MFLRLLKICYVHTFLTSEWASYINTVGFNAMPIAI